MLLSLEASLFWAALAFAVTTVVYVASLPRGSRTRRAIRNAGLSGAGVFLLTWLTLYVAGRAGARFDDFLRSAGLYYGWGVVGYGLLIAFVLYHVKKDYPRFYGVLECVIGIMALVVFSQVHEPVELQVTDHVSLATLTGWVAGFAAPIYLLVRGFGNLRAKKKEEAAIDGERGETTAL